VLYDSTSTGAKNYLALGREIIKNNKSLFENSPVFASSEG